jgi:porphobilinogen deaminase
LKLATRGSALALVQARYVASLLPVDVEIVEVKTSGGRVAAARRCRDRRGEDLR